MGNETIFVQVPVERYEDLIVTEANYNALVTAMLNTADYLYYDAKKLKFDDSVISNALRTFAPWHFSEVLKKLQDKKAEDQKALEKASSAPVKAEEV